MKLSSKMGKCGLSPMRKFTPLANAAKQNGIKVYHLNIGQPDVKTPEVFFDALKEFSAPVVSYAPSNGIDVYVKAVQRYYERIGVSLEAGEILPTNGGSEALMLTMACILDDGAEILIPEPFYPNYRTSVFLTGATVTPIPTDADKGYFYAERSRIESRINENTRAILITNPGNPTGNVLSPDELKVVLEVARDHDLFIICDEVYREFTYGGEPLLTALQYEGFEDNVIIIDSVSKRFSACGARVGTVISKNKQFMAEAMKWCQCRLCVPTVEQIAAARLYDLDPSYFDAVREEYRLRRNTMVSKLQQIPGVSCSMPGGAFYVVAKLPVDDTDAFQKWLLTEFNDNGETVLLTSAHPFYETPDMGKNEVRLAYTVNCEDISRALDILAIALEKYNA